MEKKAYQKPAVRVLTLNDALLDNIGFVEGSVDGANVLGKEHHYEENIDEDPWSHSYSVWED